MSAPKKDGPLRVKTVSFRMTIEEFRALEKLARDEGLEMADVCRRAVAARIQAAKP